MLYIPCPHCGPRNETEFHYGAEAGVGYPDPNALTDTEWAKDPKRVVPPCPADWSKEDYMKPSAELEEWRSKYYWRTTDGGCWDTLPDYLSPENDFEVLKLVRETWKNGGKTEQNLDRFWNELYEIWRKRRLDHILRLPSFEMYYEPGDYSNAALAVVESL